MNKMSIILNGIIKENRHLFYYWGCVLLWERPHPQKTEWEWD